MTAASVSNHKRSWFAYLSAGLGLLALLGVLGVLCFHFSQLLTNREFRATYEEGFARQLLLLAIVAVFILGAVAILRGRDRRVALLGVGSAALAVLALIAVTASTHTMDALVASQSVKATVQSLPIWAQFGLAVFMADLFQAGLHRIYHRVPWLWRFHAVHHSSRHMDWLAGSRTHIVEVLLTRSAVLMPLVVLGFAPGAVNAYVVLVGLQAVLAHANLGLNFGWLEYLLVTPRYHHCATIRFTRTLLDWTE